MYADLHLHSCYSDGSYRPKDLVRQAKRYQLSTLALTDHDSVEGCEEMASLCAAEGINFIPGTELTAEWQDQEIHILGYYIQVKHEKLLKELSHYQSVRQNRIFEIVGRLNRLNIPLEAESVFNLARCRSPGRPHVGRALVRGGFCQNLDEAFERFLKKHRPAWVPKAKVSALDAIRLIHMAGGIAVMAHPGLNENDDSIPFLSENELDGLECFHSKHSPEEVNHYLKLAKEYNLLITGGSDCHGHSKGKPTMGHVKLTFEYVEKLQAKHFELSQRSTWAKTTN